MSPIMSEGCHSFGPRGVPRSPTVEQVTDDFGPLTVRVVRVFTRDGGGGNHLGIHQGLLPDDAMQVIATTLGYSETIFVDDLADDGTIGVRIFTPAGELPFAGHPLVGAAWHLATPGAAVALRCGIGVVSGQRPDDDTASIDVAYLPSVERTSVPGTEQSWVALMPLPYEVHQLASPSDVADYVLTDRPDHRLVWAGRNDGWEDPVRARFFAPGMGVEEDPATGSAAVALAAVLRHEGQRSGTLTIYQGAEVGFPSRIELSWTAVDTAIGGAVTDEGRRTVSVPAGS
jgi:trans-2,3-dihydro-3-hydroxyanthranilate isomerase